MYFQFSYVFGVVEPLSVYIDTFGTAERSDREILEIISNNFDLRPGMIIR